MRKLLLVLLVLILSGCTQYTDYNSTIVDKEEVLCVDSFILPDVQVKYVAEKRLSCVFNLFLGDTSLDFREYLYSNRIDAYMQEKGELLYTTRDINNWIESYYAIWKNEMNIVYENLLSQLSGEAREMLENSQASWEYMTKYNSYLWHEVFALSTGRGTGDASMILMQGVGKVRERTFLLAEYFYWLTGDFSFYYN